MQGQTAAASYSASCAYQRASERQEDLYNKIQASMQAAADRKSALVSADVGRLRDQHQKVLERLVSGSAHRNMLNPKPFLNVSTTCWNELDMLRKAYRHAAAIIDAMFLCCPSMLLSPPTHNSGICLQNKKKNADLERRERIASSLRARLSRANRHRQKRIEAKATRAASHFDELQRLQSEQGAETSQSQG